MVQCIGACSPMKRQSVNCPLVKTDFQYFNFSNIQIVKQEGNYLFCKKLLAEIVLKYDRILKNATCNMIFFWRC